MQGIQGGVRGTFSGTNTMLVNIAVPETMPYALFFSQNMSQTLSLNKRRWNMCNNPIQESEALKLTIKRAQEHTVLSELCNKSHVAVTLGASLKDTFDI